VLTCRSPEHRFLITAPCGGTVEAASSSLAATLITAAKAAAAASSTAATSMDGSAAGQSWRRVHIVDPTQVRSRATPVVGTACVRSRLSITHCTARRFAPAW